MCLRVCALAHTVHTHHATLQATNLCHLHQNNYGGINTTFDHFHSDLSCEGARGEMIKWNWSLLCVQHSTNGRFKGVCPRLSLRLARHVWKLGPNLVSYLFQLWLHSSEFMGGDKRSCRVARGQYGDDLGVYWLQGLLLHTFPYLLSSKANSIRNLISLHYKEWYFHPADSRHCIRAFGRFNAGKGPLFWQIVDIANISCLDICVFCDME